MSPIDVLNHGGDLNHYTCTWCIPKNKGSGRIGNGIKPKSPLDIQFSSGAIIRSKSQFVQYCSDKMPENLQQHVQDQLGKDSLIKIIHTKPKELSFDTKTQ